MPTIAEMYPKLAPKKPQDVPEKRRPTIAEMVETPPKSFWGRVALGARRTVEDVSRAVRRADKALVSSVEKVVFGPPSQRHGPGGENPDVARFHPKPKEPQGLRTFTHTAITRPPYTGPAITRAPASKSAITRPPAKPEPGAVKRFVSRAAQDAVSVGKGMYTLPANIVKELASGKPREALSEAARAVKDTIDFASYVVQNPVEAVTNYPVSTVLTAMAIAEPFRASVRAFPRGPIPEGGVPALIEKPRVVEAPPLPTERPPMPVKPKPMPAQPELRALPPAQPNRVLPTAKPRTDTGAVVTPPPPEELAASELATKAAKANAAKAVNPNLQPKPFEQKHVVGQRVLVDAKGPVRVVKEVRKGSVVLEGSNRPVSKARLTVVNEPAPKPLGPGPGQAAEPAPGQAPPPSTGILGSQSGKIDVKLMEKMAAGAAAGVSVPIALAKIHDWHQRAERGELDDTVARHYMEGGALNKIQDFLQTGNYAVASVAKSIATGEPVPKLFKARTTFSDEGNAAGYLPDVLLDPMNWISPAGIASKLRMPAAQIARAIHLMPFAEKVKTYVTLLDEIPVIKKTLDWVEGVSPDRSALGFTIRPRTKRGRDLLENEIDKMISERDRLLAPGKELAEGIQKAGKDADVDVLNYVNAGWREAAREGNRAKAEAVRAAFMRELVEKKGPEHARKVAELGEKFIALENAVGKAAVEAGILEQKVLDAWAGHHARQVYDRFEDVEDYLKALRLKDPLKAAQLQSELDAIRSVASKEAGRLDWGPILQRKDLSPELRELLGENPYASVALMVGHGQMADLIARHNMYRRLADSVALDTERVKELGLAGKYRQIPDTGMIVNIGGIPTDIGKYFGDLAGKWVPEAMFYDLLNTVPVKSNAAARVLRRLTAWWKWGKVPTSPPTVARNFFTNVILADVLGKTSPWRIDLFARGARALLKKDDLYKEAYHAGVFLHDTIISQEIREVLEKASGDPYTFWARVRKLLDKPGQAYQFAENWFKMAVYASAREHGMPAEAAAAFADRALFNYRKMPRALDALRKHGIFPFIAFPYKAIPALTRRIWENPGRLSKYVKGVNTLEEQTPERVRAAERAVMPEWMREMVRLPGKASRYFDVSYIAPYGNVQGENFSPTRAISQISPALGLFADLAYNTNSFTGGRIMTPGYPKMERFKQGAAYVGKALLPAMMPGGTVWGAGVQGERGPGQPKRNLGERIAYLAGVKTSPLDVQKSLQSLALERRRVLKEAFNAMRRVLNGRPLDELSPEERRMYDGIRAKLVSDLTELTKRASDYQRYSQQVPIR